MSQQQNFYGMNNMNQMMYGYGNMQGNPIPNQQMPPNEPPKKDRLRVKMSIEEKSLFGNLFNLADKQMKGRLEGKEAAQFLKKSGLSTDILKKIWMISAQTDPNFLEKEEFYVAMRLIALAQNNMEVSDEAIKFNSPIPPLPIIDLRERKTQEQLNPNSSMVSVNQSIVQNNSVDQSMWMISDEDNKKYSELFNKNKDLENKISINKAVDMFKKSKISQDKLVRIINHVPSTDGKAYSMNEFKIIIHLIYKCYSNIDVPNLLPEVLQKFIMDNNSIPQNNQSLDFMNIIKPNTSKQPEVNNLTANFPNPTIVPNKIDSSTNVYGNFSLLPPLNQNVPLSTRNDNIANNMPPLTDTIILENKSSIGNNNFANMNMNPQVNISSPITSNNNIMANPQLNNTTKTLSFDNVKSIQNNMQSIYQETQSENVFLNKVLEEDQKLLDNLTEDINKVMKNIEMINEKNISLRNKILEIRRKINIERDNIAKANMNLQNKTNELIATTNEYIQVNEESNKFFIQNQQVNNNTFGGQSYDKPQQKFPVNPTNGFSLEKPVSSQFQNAPTNNVTGYSESLNANTTKPQVNLNPYPNNSNTGFNQIQNTNDKPQIAANPYSNNFQVANSGNDKLQNLNIPNTNNANMTNLNTIPNTFIDKPQISVNPYPNNNSGTNQIPNTYSDKPITISKSNDFNTPSNFGFDNSYPQTQNKLVTNDQPKQNLNIFNSSDLTMNQNPNPQFNKSPNLSSNNMTQVKKNDNANKSFDRFDAVPNNKNEMKFDFEDSGNKPLSTNNIVKKPDTNLAVPNMKSEFDFGFSMDAKPEMNKFEPPKTGFDVTLGNKPSAAANTSNNNNDFGFYPTFDKKPENQKPKDGFDDFGNFGDDFGNFESDFKKAQKDKDFFNDNNWGDFK